MQMRLPQPRRREERAEPGPADEERQEARSEQDVGDQQAPAEVAARPHSRKPNVINTLLQATNVVDKRRIGQQRLKELSQLRRWDIRIATVSIESHYKEPFDPFIEFTIGGDFAIVEQRVKNGPAQSVRKGTLGYTRKTEVLKGLETKEFRGFSARIRHEYLGSFFDIQEQQLRVDVWDWERWGLNRLMGRHQIPLVELAQGDLAQELVLYKHSGKKQTPLCKVQFHVTFQEVWDYVLTFTDWSATDIRGPSKALPSPKLELRLAGSKVTSHTVKDEENPH